MDLKPEEMKEAVAGRMLRMLRQRRNRSGVSYQPFHPDFHTNPPCTRTISGRRVTGTALAVKPGVIECTYG